METIPLPDNVIRWTTGLLTVTISVEDARARLTGVEVGGTAFLSPATPLPLVEVGVVGEGRSWSSRRYIDSVVGERMRYLDHSVDQDRSWPRLTVNSHDTETGLTLSTTLTAGTDGRTIRVQSTATNSGRDDVDLAWVSSAVLGGVLGGTSALETVDVWWADNDWLAENRWQHSAVRALLPDLTRAVHEHDPRGVFGRTALGAWSTDGTLPVGFLVDRQTNRGVGWQIEHNGSWHWQVGERTDGLFISLLGPTQTEHDWAARLQPGESFTSVPAALALSVDGVEGAVAALTAARRASRRPHRDHEQLPVIFNDYMNTLMGDPTTDKLIPLIDAAAEVGADTFCIDAGWYDDNADGWWDSVGAWEPATTRFPGGLEKVLQRIREKGMVPGLWLEPEVVGVRSEVATQLPDEAFFLRHGRRVVEHGRFQLDLRHPAARAHLDKVVDRLVDDMGVGYFKLDYNINPGSGTDHDAFTAGAGLMAHNRAYLQWIDGVLDRHPDLTLENCASGGMRVDYAMLSRLQLQSTSDQQDPYRYPPIAAAAAAAVTPEQAASWVYPQPHFSNDDIAFTMSAGLLGRMHLSGHLDKMSDAQRGLVTQAVNAYRTHRQVVRDGFAFWPLGLPHWDDEWIAHGLRHEGTALVTFWRRDGDHATQTVLVQELTETTTVRIVYPVDGGATVRTVVVNDATHLEVTLPQPRQAVTVAIEPTDDPTTGRDVTAQL